jgi:hypothetical protein
VQDYQACVRGSCDGVVTFLLSDPGGDTVEVYEKAFRQWLMLGQLMAWRCGGHENLPQAAQPQNSALVLQAHDAVQKYAPDIKNNVAAPFRGLDLKVLQQDAYRLGFVRSMKQAQQVFTESLDRVDAWTAQSISQRLRPIYEYAWPVVGKLPYLSEPLSPLHKLFAGAAEEGVETKAKIAQALARQKGPAGGTPPAGTGTGESGAPAGGTPAAGTPPATPRNPTR